MKYPNNFETVSLQLEKALHSIDFDEDVGLIKNKSSLTCCKNGAEIYITASYFPTYSSLLTDDDGNDYAKADLKTQINPGVHLYGTPAEVLDIAQFIVECCNKVKELETQFPSMVYMLFYTVEQKQERNEKRKQKLVKEALVPIIKGMRQQGIKIIKDDSLPPGQYNIEINSKQYFIDIGKDFVVQIVRIK